MNDRDRRPWMKVPPERLIGRGHAAGDFLEAYDWTVVEEREGYLKINAHVPQHVRNPRGQLFGGFTPAYVDLVALFTTRAGAERQTGEIKRWLATTNMRVDYLEPVLGQTFWIESFLIRRRNRMNFVETRFLDEQGTILVFALTTMREIAPEKTLGDA
jgi:acyl-coenzyme A thioesterase PaaI-like protein